ncbi:NAD(P)H-dependent oxidoreductase [Flavobacterium sp. WC2509]|uniref:NAD(P)H-dependent oxidoreductase n=1 Tax=Flavobacterium sp. WC2509 TaxID=3461406 RepID=UPI004044BDFF
MENKKKVLLINAHLTYPNWTEGTLNNAFQNVAKEFFQAKGYEVLETKIESGYTIEEEVEKHLETAIVILQMPVNWFGAPWIYKKYADEVFNSALHSQKFLSGDGRTREDITKQYGSGGKMQGRKFMICATLNAPKEAFDNPEQNLLQGKSSTDLFLNITSNYRFCGYDIAPEFNCYNIFKRDDIAKDLESYPLHLEKLLAS